MKLLQEDARLRCEHDERERAEVRERLQVALSTLLPPGTQAWVFGSLTKPGRFREWSDVDVALESESQNVRLYLLMSLLAEAVGRPVDLLLLNETRLREMILREGERWIA